MIGGERDSALRLDPVELRIVQAGFQLAHTQLRQPARRPFPCPYSVAYRLVTGHRSNVTSTAPGSALNAVGARR
ncbi:hypothetical protein GCM10010253_67060 [Streptomyces badius]|uniref:Uncharacterized protein n=1 Tax=Streptomyces badius TaxID=1941 RepID=A0ABQ2TP80_STRBA|nr:hypothetical protein GCM10010253_67060 [Streptomyces badius]